MTTLRAVIQEFALLPSSSDDRWLIAADWLEEQGEMLAAEAIRAGLREPDPGFYGETKDLPAPTWRGFGNGDGIGNGDGSGDGAGHASGEGDGTGFGYGLGSNTYCSLTGPRASYGDGSGRGQGDGTGSGAGDTREPDPFVI